MKNVSIDLTEEHAAFIEAEIATGDFASVSEVIAAALHEFFERPSGGPSEEQVLADIAQHKADRAAGIPLLDPDEVRAMIRAVLEEK